MEKKNIKIIAWASAAVGSMSLLLFSPDTVDTFTRNLSDAGQSQFSKNLFIFSLAAVIHSGRMKKEIRNNFDALVTSIDKVSATLREDLGKHGEILRGHGELLQRHGVALDGLGNRVDKLETCKPVAIQ